MRRNWLSSMALVVLSTAIVIGAGCEDGYIFPNEAPSNLEITKLSCYVATGEEVPLIGSADDEDGDPLYYSWATNAGTFDPAGGGEMVTWIAPDDPGLAVITLIVTDDIEESRLQTTIEVGAEFPVDIVTNRPRYPAIADSGYVYLLNLQPVVILGGTTFTIMEGVRIVARGTNSGFEVTGRLLIQGTEENPVTMGPDDCEPVGGSWAGIAFVGPAAEGNIAYLQQHAADVGVLVQASAEVVIGNSYLTNNKRHGIEVSDGGTLEVSDCTIWENYTGIYMRNGYMVVEGSSLRYNRKSGIDMSSSIDGYTPTVTHCQVSNNREYGFELSGFVTPEMHYNSLYSNGVVGVGYGVYLGSYVGVDSIRAENNFWGLGYDSEETIPALIWDAHDASSIEAYVDFIPWLSSAPAGLSGP